MNRHQTVFLISAILLFAVIASAQNLQARKEISIPDIPGYITLIADLHTHTVLSDGYVHPAIRPDEAWREGVDVLSITDHIEYQPHKEWIPTNHNLSYKLAKGKSDQLGVMLIKGSEVTRSLPLGHYNAIFLSDCDALDVDDPMDAFKAASEQGAFVFWNHPGWPREDGIPVWEEVQEELFQKGYMHGIEVVNTRKYYPLAHKWALEKKITMIGTSDIHMPIGMDYDHRHGDHRAVTILFVTERTPEGVRDALDNRRTAVYHDDILIGEDKYLKPVFMNSIEVVTPEISIAGKGHTLLQIKNNSDVPYKLKRSSSDETRISYSDEIILIPHRTVLVWINGRSETELGRFEANLEYVVENLYVLPETGMNVRIPIVVDHSAK
jgi:predicted metal-dependent phosphoesterase TrpH